MPPKVRITKEDIINAAIEIVRKDGAQAINARNLAAYLNCSTQPVFSNFKTMEELHFAVLKKANEMYEEYIKTEIESQNYPPFKASGMAYIRFARDEKELFKLLYMRDRTTETVEYYPQSTEHIKKLIQSNTGLNEEEVKLFHLESWLYVHGIATMFATGFLDLEWELISKMLTDFYIGLKKQYEV